MPSFREALSLDGVGQVAVSPDGRMVAYTVRSVDWDENGYDTEVWLASADREPYHLTRTVEGSSGSPQCWQWFGRHLWGEDVEMPMDVEPGAGPSSEGADGG